MNPTVTQIHDSSVLIARSQALGTDFATRAAEHDRSRVVSHDNITALHKAGLLNLAIPEAFGGPEFSLQTSAQIIANIAKGDPSTALLLLMQAHQHKKLATSGNWPKAIKHRVLDAAREKGALINALRVEPELGSPIRGGLPLTTARKTATGWLLSGHKIYSTGSPILSWAIVWAVTDELPARVGQFLVPFDAPGIDIQYETWDHMGLRASGSHDVVFHNVPLPADHAVDIRAPEAWGPPTASFDVWINMSLSALYTGVATAARDWLVNWLQTRTPSNLGAPLATVPRLQSALGEIEALLQTNRIMIADVARRGDAKQLEGAESSLLKYIATGNAIRICEKALAMTGNTGLTRSNPLERHLRDALCSRVHQPQDDMILAYAGRAALGLR